MTAPRPNVYLRTKVMTANPAELRLMLFDGAICFAEHGRAGLAERDYEKAYRGITRCQAILMELINGLRPEQDPELCRKLSALYTFMYTRLMEASGARDPSIVDEVLNLLRYERQTWQLLLEKLAGENRSAAGLEAVAADRPAEAPATDPRTRTHPDQVPGGSSGLIGGTVWLEG